MRKFPAPKVAKICQQFVKETSFFYLRCLFDNINHFESSKFLHVTSSWDPQHTANTRMFKMMLLETLPFTTLLFIFHSND